MYMCIKIFFVNLQLVAPLAQTRTICLKKRTLEWLSRWCFE
jgi:hypothetical protein